MALLFGRLSSMAGAIRSLPGNIQTRVQIQRRLREIARTSYYRRPRIGDAIPQRFTPSRRLLYIGAGLGTAGGGLALYLHATRHGKPNQELYQRGPQYGPYGY